MHSPWAKVQRAALLQIADPAQSAWLPGAQCPLTNAHFADALHAELPAHAASSGPSAQAPAMSMHAPQLSFAALQPLDCRQSAGDLATHCLPSPSNWQSPQQLQ
jgi:hypothetical protein